MKIPIHIQNKIFKNFNKDLTEILSFEQANYNSLLYKQKDFPNEFKYEVCVLKKGSDYYLYYFEVEYDYKSKGQSLADSDFECIQKFSSIGDLDSFVKLNDIMPSDLVKLINIKESVKNKENLEGVIGKKEKKLKKSKI